MNTDKVAEYCLLTAVLVAVLLSFVFWGMWLAVLAVWVLAFPFAMLLGLIIGFVANFIGLTVDEESEESDEDAIWSNENDVVLLDKSTDIVGKLQNEIIYEWIVLERPDNKQPIKLSYSHTVDMSAGSKFELPANKWFCILPPGIVYAHPEN